MDWINIAIRQPGHNEEVLVTDGDIVTAAQADRQFYQDGRIRWSGWGFSGYEWEYDFEEITHWMPLPSPPIKE